MNVFLYSSEGKQIRQIGNKGNARYEYSHPSAVRIYKDTIYVWSSFTLRFISYTMDGEPIEEYPYLSAIVDLIPTDLSDLRLIFAKENVHLEKDEMEQILAILEKYEVIE